MDDLARELGISTRSSCGAATSSCPATAFVVTGARGDRPDVRLATASTSASTWSRRRWPGPRREPAPEGWPASAPGWRVAMIATIPPRGHYCRGVSVSVDADGRRTRSTSAPPSSATAPRPCTCQLVAQELGTTVGPDARPAVRHRRDRATTPARSARPARSSPARPCSWPPNGCAASCCRALLDARGLATGPCTSASTASLPDGRSSASTRSSSAPSRPAARTTGRRGRSRSTCTASGSRSTRRPARCASCGRCRPSTPGVVINPEQLRGQVEGGIGPGDRHRRCTRRWCSREGEVLTAYVPAATACRRWPTSRRPRCSSPTPYDDLGPHGREVDERGARTTRSPRRWPTRSATPSASRPYELPMSRDRLWRMLNG